MSTFTIDEAKLRRDIDLAMREWARVSVDLIIDQTPRDWKRPPKNINRKDGKKPRRAGGVVSRGGSYYNAVTGALASSIGFEKSGGAQYDIGVRKWPASAYAKAQEFGWVHTPPRPYVRKAFIEGSREIISAVLFTFYQATK